MERRFFFLLKYLAIDYNPLGDVVIQMNGDIMKIHKGHKYQVYTYTRIQ